MRKYLSSKLHPPSAMQEGTIHMTSAQEKAFKHEGMRVVLGGVLIHFVLGTFYLWGGISIYVASYLRSYDENVDIDLVKMVFPLMFIGINAMLSLGVKTADKIGHKIICFFGVGCIAAAAFVVSFISNYILFIIIYTVMVGLSSGLVYMVPVVCGWKYFPKRKGLVSGTIIAGYGFGSFTFNLIALQLVNPENKEIPPGQKYFEEDVYSRVPFMFRILSLMYLVIGIFGCLLVKMPKSVPIEHHDEHDILVKEGQKKTPKPHEHHDCQTIREGVLSRHFWILFIMVIGGSFFGLLMANNYKVYGLTRIADDSWVTLVGSIGSASNGCSRLFWAALYDRFGFKKVYFILMAIQIAIAGTLDMIAGVKILYLFWHSITMATEGGQFSIMPAVTSKTFGPKIGPVIYGILYIGFSIANLGSFFLTKFSLKSLGWPAIFWICFGFSVLAFVFNLLFNENSEVISKYKKKSNELTKLPNSPELHDTHEIHDIHDIHDEEKH